MFRLLGRGPDLYTLERIDQDQPLSIITLKVGRSTKKLNFELEAIIMIYHRLFTC